jgi:hypothetical protein
VYLPGLATFLDLFLIRYVVPHEPQNLADASPFQGFTPGVLDNTHVYRAIATLPRDVSELVSGREGVLGQRVFRSGYSVFPMQIEVVRPFLDTAHPAFCCIWSSTVALAEQVQAAIQDWPHPLLHVTPEEAGFGCAEAELDRDRLREYARQVLEHWERTGEQPMMARSLRASIDDPDDLGAKPIALRRRRHLLTSPNETALAATGHSLDAAEEPLLGMNNGPYLEALRESVEAVRAQRELAFEGNPYMRGMVPYDTILTAPSMYKAFDAYKKQLRRDLSETTRKTLTALLQQMALRGTYNFLETGQGHLVRAFNSPEGQALIRIRQEEILAYTAALELRASSNLVPVIRLPPSVNLVRQELTHLGTAARSRSPHRSRKVSDLTRKLSDKLAAGIPEWITNEIRDSEGIKLVTDAPLEWFPIDGVPLALRVDCSRITTTPGDHFLGKMTSIPEIVLQATDFDEVLVVRAFAPDDPIRDKVTRAIEVVSRRRPGSGPQVRYADVVSEDDLIAALNEFRGALMVYDGHGMHSAESDIGVLRLPGGDVDVWELRGRARVPPIVILSACDTHPFDASHATTANGFLAAGAETVLATSLPVDADYAAVFIGRLLLRIGEFMPLLLRRPHGSARWSEVLPGLQRRQYCTEALLAIDGKDGITLGDLGRVRVEFDVGMRIDKWDCTWFDFLIERAAQEAGVTADRVRNAIRREAYLTDALLYIQMGSPERLVVFDPSAKRLRNLNEWREND